MIWRTKRIGGLGRCVCRRSRNLPAAAGALAPGVGASFASGDPLITDVKAKFKRTTVHVNKTVKINKTVKVNKNVYVNKKVVVRPYKAWVRSPITAASLPASRLAPSSP